MDSQTLNTSKLLACNDDVLRLILEDDCLTRHDISRVCLVQTRLRQLAEPILYSTIHFETWEEAGKNIKPHPISSFLRTILSRPDLGTLIRTLDCDGQSYYLTRRRPHAPLMSASELDIEVFVAHLQQNDRIHATHRDGLIEDLRRGVMDAYLALLLCNLPNLRHLHLGWDFFMESKWIGKTLRSLLCNFSRPALQHVQTISLERREGRKTESPVRNTQDILPFFYLPNLQNLTVSADCPEPGTKTITWPTSAPPSPASLVSLKLTQIRESHLGQLLSVVPNLRALHWEWNFDPGFEDEFNTARVDLPLITQALEHVRETLTELNIETTIGYDDGGDSLQERLRVVGAPPTSLSRLHRLKKLTIPLAFLTGLSIPNEGVEAGRLLEESLPRNLEALAVRSDLFGDMDDNWDEDAYIRAISSWLQKVPNTLPRLRRMVVEVGFDDPGCSDSDHDICRLKNEMRDVARRAGIRLDFIPGEPVI